MCQLFSLFLARRLLQCIKCYNSFPAENKWIALNFFLQELTFLGLLWFSMLLKKREEKKDGGEGEEVEVGWCQGKSKSSSRCFFFFFLSFLSDFCSAHITWITISELQPLGSQGLWKQTDSSASFLAAVYIKTKDMQGLQSVAIATCKQ